ncbi:uncharacterized protein LOC110604981 isoform X2 [Manihot esculenta]|uniref:Protein XRI1 n=1 Tax=Manihot esculenta TaxID=3983 RepID=A0A2C9U6L6_MANES|nr:uncharacterized protein LOC110604981 isoform X2 [Manihot esculenta]OAY25401.1 hypothetical protein MANES_17G091300v8 [Manihot esculenta]
MAYSSSRYFHGSSSLGGCWDLQNLGLLNADTMSLVMDGVSPFFSSLESDFSTGYLEDALLEFSERSKRRRLLLYTDDHTKISDDHHFAKSYWNENCEWEMSENLSCMRHLTSSIHGVSEPISTSLSNMSEEEANVITEMKTPEEEIAATPEILDSSSSSFKNSAKRKSIFENDNLQDHSGEDKRKKRMITRVVYPFALVKPGGVEGDMTINDINERILMPPTRPVRHPVGDFACRPCVSADGPGLSGKAVVALTRIHTQGRGTITIIRTKG